MKSMSMDGDKDNTYEPATLQEAKNIIRFLTTSHKQEIAKLKESYLKQADRIKKLEANRKKELEFLSSELLKYELNLAARTEAVTKQLAQKDDIIRKQTEVIEELNVKLKMKDVNVPEMTVVVDSNSDSGVALENEDNNSKTEEVKTEIKATRKCSRRFGDPISYLRRIDFSPMKYKPSNTKKKDDKKKGLEVPCQSALERQISVDKVTSEDERGLVSEDSILSDSTIEPVFIRPKKMNDSMNNHFSDDGSEDTSEEIFDRVMTRSSIRRSVKANPKYKKINRTKSKLLEQVKVNIID